MRKNQKPNEDQNVEVGDDVFKAKNEVDAPPKTGGVDAKAKDIDQIEEKNKQEDLEMGAKGE